SIGVYYQLLLAPLYHRRYSSPNTPAKGLSACLRQTPSELSRTVCALPALHSGARENGRAPIPAPADSSAAGDWRACADSSGLVLREAGSTFDARQRCVGCQPRVESDASAFAGRQTPVVRILSST